MKHHQDERGVALIICLFALMLLSGIGLGMMYMADTETSINRNYRDSQQAYFAAIAGLQETRSQLMTGSVFPFPTTMPKANANTGVVYVLNYTASIARDSITPWNMALDNPYRDTEFCHENFADNSTPPQPLAPNTGPNQPCTAVPGGTYYKTVDSSLPGTLLGTDSNLAYRWVRVTWKANASAVPSDPATTLTGFYVGTNAGANTIPNNAQICWNGDQEVPIPAGYATCDADPPDGVTYLKSVYVLTSLAITPNTNGSRRMVQMEVANNPPFVTNAALDTNNFVSVSGSSVTVNGYDNCKCDCTTAVGKSAPTCKDRTPGSCTSNNTFAIFSSRTVTTSGSPVMIAGTTQPGCTLPSCNPAVAQNQTFPYNVGNLIDKYKSMVGTVNITSAPYNNNCVAAPIGSTPGYANCGQLNSGTMGTLPSPWPPKDPNTAVGQVNQITYVPGSFDIQAHSSGAGVLIVDGDLTIHGGLEFYGLIIVRGVLTFAGSGTGQDLNVLGSIIAGQGSVADTLNGGVNVQYDRCALLSLTTPQPPQLLATHETMY